MSFYNWQGPSGKIRTGTTTHFVDLLGTPHSSPIYNDLAKKPKKDMSKVKVQLFTMGRKIPPTWKNIGKIK